MVYGDKEIIEKIREQNPRDIREFIMSAEDIGVSAAAISIAENDEFKLCSRNGYVHIDERGEVIAADGEYSKFLDEWYDISELENMLDKDTKEILDGSYEILILKEI